MKKVNILGEQAQRVFVEFSYQRLATLGIKPEQIFAALAAQNGVSPPASSKPPGRVPTSASTAPSTPSR